MSSVREGVSNVMGGLVRFARRRRQPQNRSSRLGGSAADYGTTTPI